VSELEALVHDIGGVESLASCLDVEPDIIAVALRAPEGAWTDRVRKMVAENTTKLVLMPSQGGFFWRLTRKRVAKDWLLLSRWSDSISGQRTSS
jgi:hypothetical protein